MLISKSIYSSKKIWKDTESKYAPLFFEDTGDAKKNEENQSLFQGLKIMEQGEEYVEHMGEYPVINLTLKSAK